jgi:hypothetical protein
VSAPNPAGAVTVALDAIWVAHAIREISTPTAVARIREIADVTEYGARELLHSEVRPSRRYGAIVPDDELVEVVEEPDPPAARIALAVVAALLLLALVVWAVNQ